jgi:oxygen-independent coproporphyrinogen-3 oxidase
MPLSLPDDHLGLYVHVPFCVRKCAYCDFPSQACADGARFDRYLDALAREVAARWPARPVSSVYIGGGTPTVLGGARLRRLWAIVDAIPRAADAEITLEANPGTLGGDVPAALAALPLTRVSLGAQSFQADELAALGRIHTPDEIAAAVAVVRAAGVAQVNLDLMYGLPGQTPASWADTLHRALALAPDHLSAYALIVEEGTPLADGVASGAVILPDDDAEAAMADALADTLAAAGMVPYEVSNAAQPGRHSRHNLGYWLGRDYLGLGPGAVSTLAGLRWRNGLLPAYLAGDGLAVDYIERLAAPARLLETVMLGLRLRDGFDLSAAEVACGVTLAAVAGDALPALIADGLLDHDGDTLRCTDTGFSLANLVVARLMGGDRVES